MLIPKGHRGPQYVVHPGNVEGNDMSTADTVLSIASKMAPGPNHHQEPVAPDKTAENSHMETASESSTEALLITGAEAVVAQSASTDNASAKPDVIPDSTGESSLLNSGSDNKQEEPATLSTLNEGELRALLDEAITYKCPKDREGKSNLFKELLQEAEADETEEGRRVIANSRCLPGSNRRRHKRDSVSERLTHGGSLQNLAQPLASEFDSSFAYLTSGSAHTYGGSKRKNKKYTGPSVSARQREGGSLPSNVNASHSLASLANLDLIFDKKKGFCEERAVYDWTNKEKSKSLDKPSYNNSKKEEKDRDKRETKKDLTSGSGEIEAEVRERRSSKVKHGTNEMLESDNLPSEYKIDYAVDDIGDVEVGALSDRNAGSTISGVQRPHPMDTEDDEGTEMKIIDSRKSIHTSRATFDRAQTPVDATVEFPIRDHGGKSDKSKISVNGAEITGALPFHTHSSMKGVATGTANSSNSSQGKVVPSLCSVMTWQPPNFPMVRGFCTEGSRYTAQHITMKDSASSGEKKSLDENGNAVQVYNGEQQKKPRRKHTREPNVITYKAENVKGHRYERDIEILVNFIENKESRGKKGKAGNAVRVKTSSGTKPRTREKDSKKEQLHSKLHKSNSLEEISKTKLEDLTIEKSVSSSGASSISSQHGTINVALRRAKQRSTGDATVDCRGDRRSWGTEEGQSIYCNDTGDDYTSRRNATKKMNAEPEPEPEFLVVTKKKKSKKQRRSSSGSRAQNLVTSGSYLQNSKGFPNEYRTPLSPELRRKSASSMPPSDKSDSSDLDSVHSLPVTSNSSKHNLSKINTLSGSTPQASYADIARMATINMSHTSVLSMSVMVPNMLSPASWPSVPPKTPSEPDKAPQDYYPSLDELQHSDRKARQHSFVHSNHMNNINLNYEKPSSPPLVKIKNSSDRKKAEAQEEAINKNIQVFKYVQDIEKMHQSLTQQEQKHASSTNYSTNSNEITLTNPTPSKPNNPLAISSLVESDNNNSSYTVNNKDATINSRCEGARSRRAYVQGNQNLHNQVLHEEQHHKKVSYSLQDDAVKKPHNVESPASHSENKCNPVSGSYDDSDVQKSKVQSNPKSSQDIQNIDPDAASRTTKPDRSAKTTREQHSNTTSIITTASTTTITNTIATNTNTTNTTTSNSSIKSDTGKATQQTLSQNSKQDSDENDNKKTKQPSVTHAEKEQLQKLTEVQMSSKKTNSSRPAVILMDETTSDVSKSSDLPTELTFGFEINEQLLQSEESEETSTASPVFTTVVPPLIDKPPPNFDRPPPMFDKHMRYDKFPPNFHIQPPSAHVTQQPVHPVMIQPLPYMGYPTRFPPPPYLPAPPPPPPPGIMEKYHHPPKEDFSTLYVPPEEDVNVQNYNHDKIVSFVGLAWDAVIATGHIEYYNSQ